MVEYDVHLWRRTIPISLDVENAKASIDDRSFAIETTRYGNRVIVELNGKPYTVEIIEGRVYVNGEQQQFSVRRGRPKFLSKVATRKAQGGAKINAPIPGRVVSMKVAVGDMVTKGQPLFVLEAMKMQNEVASPTDGTVRAVHAKDGENVDAAKVLVEIE